MSKKLEGKIAVITGGSSGIGLATAKRFIQEGAEVVIVARRQEQLDIAQSQLGGHVLAVKADVSKIAELDKLYEEIKKRHGRLDIVFANAGGTGQPTPILNLSESDYVDVFDQNVKSVLFTVQKALPLLSDGGSIILTASVASIKGLAGASLYGATKAAVRSFARTWANELKGRGIRVNSISPGPINTPLHAGIENNPAVAAAVARMLKSIPAGRRGEPDEIASAVVFLASADASYITGIELYVDGGMTQI